MTAEKGVIPKVHMPLFCLVHSIEKLMRCGEMAA